MLSSGEFDSSNLVLIVEKGLRIAENISEIWASSSFDDKRKLQDLIFPEGILNNKQKNIVRTPRINSIFAPIPILSGHLKDNKKSHSKKSDLNSHLVEEARIESEDFA